MLKTFDLKENFENLGEGNFVYTINSNFEHITNFYIKSKKYLIIIQSNSISNEDIAKEQGTKAAKLILEKINKL